MTMLNDWGGQTFPHLPGRRPVVGDMFSVRPSEPLQSVMEQCGDLGPIFEMNVFRQKFVFVTSATLAAELSDEKRFEKALSPALVALRDFAGAGLFTAYNDETNWELAHTLLMPAFTKAEMQRYHPIMVGAAQELFDSWAAVDRPIDVAADMTRLTLETISRAAFSTDFGSFRRADPHPFVTAMIVALTTGQRKGSLNAMPGSAALTKRIERRNAHHQAYVDELLDGIISDRRAEPPGDRDLLDIMLNTSHPETGARLDDVNIRHQILTFLVAGHETTSGALSFALYYLARHPEALAKAHAEVDELLGADRTAEPTFEQVPKFRHVRRVIDESLRLWPTAPAYTRTPREELTLSTGHTMRPGDWAIILLPATHRDPEVWGETADRFDPERFTVDRSRGRTPQTYKPFGTGERSCIGRQFALHEAVLVLAMMLHRYDIAGDPDYELKIAERLTLMPVGFELVLTSRG